MSDKPTWTAAGPFAKVLAASFEDGDTTRYSRSDILRALTRPLVGTATAFPILSLAKAPVWALQGDAAAFGVTLIIYLGAYIYSFFRRPDSLRSEQYELTKYAIEHRMFGDDTQGLIEGEVIKAISNEGSILPSNAAPDDAQ